MTALETVSERLRAVFDQGRVQTIFGETRVVDGAEVIPVGRVSGGFGFGGGKQNLKNTLWRIVRIIHFASLKSEIPKPPVTALLQSF